METKKKRGRPPTGQSQDIWERNHQISGWYNAARERGLPERDAIKEVAELLELNGYGVFDCKEDGAETIRKAIKDSRKMFVLDEEFKYSSRLQKAKMNEPWQDIFEIDPETGEVIPKPI